MSFRIAATVLYILTFSWSIARCESPKLTGESVRPLIAKAAGVPNKEFEKLSSETNLDKIKNWPFTLIIWAAIPGELSNMDFQFLSDSLSPSDLVKAAWISKSDGFASFIQAKYITACTCDTKGDSATGVVEFRAEKLYEGKLAYRAERRKDEWVITEFRLTNSKITIARDAGGHWSRVQEKK